MKKCEDVERILKENNYSDMELGKEYIERILSDFPKCNVASIINSLFSYNYDKTTTCILTFDQFSEHVKFLEVIDTYEDKESFAVAQRAVNEIDLSAFVEALAEKLGRTLGNGENIYNQKLEVHQPSMPLFYYNEYKAVTDMCTDVLNEEIQIGWRVICVCPQPDQRRPDYILGRQTENKN